MSTAGSIIQLARLKSNLSQRELATEAGTSGAAIAAYETGRREPTMPTLLRILRAAGFDLRLHLTPYDPHDEVLRRWVEALPADARRELPRRRRTTAERLRQPVT
jgi:transcriptional regulator with XRE-family HTH domain